MKKSIIFLSILMALSLFFTACVSGTPGVPPASTGPAATYPFPPSSQQTGLWVNGEGKATYVPDIAVLSLGIEAQEKTVAQAQNSAREAMNRVLAALKAKNIAEKDIRTQTFNIQPVKQWIEPLPTPRGAPEPGYKPPPKEVTIGYRVSNTVTVKIRRIDDAGTIIDAVASAGGDLTRINSIGFTLDDATPIRAQAREKAVKDAMAKAQQIASAAGVTLGKVTYITESGGFVPKVSDVRSFGAAMALSAEAAPTPISPGEVELSVSVQMVFEMK